MTHITLSKKTTSKPCLEFFSDGVGEARRVTIEDCPFRIGRAESADLRVESVQVSREHVEIVERNGVWLVRDLGSTNGTQVNGKSIKEAMLTDGDILKVAETELTFIASAASQFQRMVTQPVQSKKMVEAACALPLELAALRMTTEATLCQVIPTQLYSATSLRHDVSEAYFSAATGGVRLKPTLDQQCAVGDRYRELERMNALELALRQTEVKRLFFAVGAPEIDAPHRLLTSFKQLQALLPSSWELGMTISLPTDLDIMRIAELYRNAQEQEIRIAFDEFQGNGAQVLHLKSCLPDYLLLASSMTKDLTSTRQPLRRLESLLEACTELAIKPVLPRNDSSHVVALCEEIGFDLMLTSTVRSVRPKQSEPKASHLVGTC